MGMDRITRWASSNAQRWTAGPVIVATAVRKRKALAKERARMITGPVWVPASREGKQRGRSYSPKERTYRLLSLGVVAGIAATVTTHLATPDGDERACIAVRAAPGQDVAIGGLDNDEDVTGALVCHVLFVFI